jgi:transitional endoplasmic reticulum ATPase
VPYAYISPAQVSSKYVGQAADLVSQVFEEARKHQPCVLFFDELDSIANNRSGGMEQTRSERQSITQLLQEMQEIQGSDILVIAATNLVEDVDGAVRRSGRFDTEINVPEPGEDTRREVFRVHLKDRETADWIDLDSLAEFTNGYSCSDIEAAVRSAVRTAARESTEQDELKPVTYQHLLQAVKNTEPSLKSWEA